MKVLRQDGPLRFVADSGSDEVISGLCPKMVQFYDMPAIDVFEKELMGAGMLVSVLLKTGSSLFISLDSFATCSSMFKVLRW